MTNPKAKQKNPQPQSGLTAWDEDEQELAPEVERSVEEFEKAFRESYREKIEAAEKSNRHLELDRQA